MVFPVIMFGCESWTIKKAKHQRIDAFELVLEKTLESPLDCKEIQPVYPKFRKSVLNIHWKDWHWSWNSNTLATWCKELTHLIRPSCWERLKVGGKGDDRGWDGCFASEIQWSWVWVNSGSCWWTRRPGVVQSVGSQRVRHNCATELNWNESCCRSSDQFHRAQNKIIRKTPGNEMTKVLLPDKKNILDKQEIQGN